MSYVQPDGEVVRVRKDTKPPKPPEPKKEVKVPFWMYAVGVLLMLWVFISAL